MPSVFESRPGAAWLRKHNRSDAVRLGQAVGNGQFLCPVSGDRPLRLDLHHHPIRKSTEGLMWRGAKTLALAKLVPSASTAHLPRGETPQSGPSAPVRLSQLARWRR